MAHFVSAVFSNSFHLKKKHPLKFEFPVGIVTPQSPEWRLRSDIGERRQKNQYVYQKGKHYISASEDGAGTISANIKKKAPGIEVIAMFRLNGERVAIGGRWGDELCLIGG